MDFKTGAKAVLSILIIFVFGIILFKIGRGMGSGVGILTIAGAMSIYLGSLGFSSMIDEMRRKKGTNDDKPEKVNNALAMFICVVTIIILIATSSNGGNSSYDNSIAYDPDGFLGYSDSFWEWWGDQ